MTTTAAAIQANDFVTVLGMNARDIVRVGLARKVRSAATTVTVTWADGDVITYSAGRPVRVA